MSDIYGEVMKFWRLHYIFFSALFLIMKCDELKKNTPEILLYKTKDLI